jgi:hypothetical protein
MTIFLADRINEVILTCQKQGIEGRTHSCNLPPTIQV